MISNDFNGLFLNHNFFKTADITLNLSSTVALTNQNDQEMCWSINFLFSKNKKRIN